MSRLYVSHDVEQVKFMDDFFWAYPQLKEFSEFMETQLKVFILEVLVELPSFSRFWL